MKTAQPEARGGLAACLRAADGISRHAALERAEDNIELHRADALQAVYAALDRMTALLAVQDACAQADAMREDANTIAGVAALYHAPAAGKAAGSLCEFLALNAETGYWDDEVVRIYMHSIALLLNTRGPQDAHKRVLEGLSAMLKSATQRAQARQVEPTPGDAA